MNPFTFLPSFRARHDPCPLFLPCRQGSSPRRYIAASHFAGRALRIAPRRLCRSLPCAGPRPREFFARSQSTGEGRRAARRVQGSELCHTTVHCCATRPFRTPTLTLSRPLRRSPPRWRAHPTSPICREETIACSSVLAPDSLLLRVACLLY